MTEGAYHSNVERYDLLLKCISVDTPVGFKNHLPLLEITKKEVGTSVFLTEHFFYTCTIILMRFIKYIYLTRFNDLYGF